ncbi:MAG: phage holin family protein [Oscillospiraceae bacterium]|jgi:uncharacterized membrane protein YvlD (DUF360 family)|nr:phage holin family protein [Oscillospiraceae bacterium]
MRGFLWKCAGTIAAAVASAYILPGIRCADWEHAAAAGVLLAVAYALFRPVARILLGVFNLLTLGLMGIIIDAGLFYACAMRIDGVEIDSFAWALAAALLVNAARAAAGLAGRGRTIK